jgi:hypothetical protein
MIFNHLNLIFYHIAQQIIISNPMYIMEYKLNAKILHPI